MATIADILTIKGSSLLSIGPEAMVLDAARLMNERKIGSLLVMDAGRLIGIITERDMLQRVLVPRLDPALTPVFAICPCSMATNSCWD